MSEAKFTKGRWSPYIGDCDTQEIKCDGKTVISWQGFDGLIIDESEKIANANLISAAPEMYEVLFKIKETIESGLYEIDLADAIHNIGDDIKRSLDKATGSKP